MPHPPHVYIYIFHIPVYLEYHAWWWFWWYLWISGLVPNESDDTWPEGFSTGRLDGIYLMIIMKGLECSLLVPNERKNTRPEGLQVLEGWHPPDDNYEGSWVQPPGLQWGKEHQARRPPGSGRLASSPDRFSCSPRNTSRPDFTQKLINFIVFSVIQPILPISCT